MKMILDLNAGAVPDEHLSEADFDGYRWDEIWYAETEDEKAYFIHLDGAMRHPGEVCDCPPEEPYRAEADELIDIVFNAPMNSEMRTLQVAAYLRSFRDIRDEDIDE